MNDDTERDLEALLRSHTERLSPPEELWASVQRRARRRRQGKALLAVAAAVVVIAGAIPAVIAVRHNSSNSSLQFANRPSQSPPVAAPRIRSTAVPRSPATLKRLIPQSVSFVSQTEGWVSGDTQVGSGTVTGGLGRTTDAGGHWAAQAASPPPTGTVRFANSDVGFSFGSSYQLTRDGGQSWTTLPTPGNILDLETMNGAVWALVQSCTECRAPRLFTATLDSPTLHRVSDVSPIAPYDAAITLVGGSVVVTGGEDLWSSGDGQSWRKGINPCGSGPQGFSAWSQTDLAAECTPVRGVGSLFESNDGGLQWTNIANLPNVTASGATLSAGTWNHLIITTGVGAPYVTFDDGTHWKRATTGDAPVTFAAYISPTHIVGIRGGPDPAYMSSYDSGRTWTATPFAG